MVLDAELLGLMVAYAPTKKKGLSSVIEPVFLNRSRFRVATRHKLEDLQ